MADSGSFVPKMESTSKRMASTIAALTLGFFAILLIFDGGAASFIERDKDTTKTAIGPLETFDVFFGGLSSKRRNLDHKSMSEEEKERLMQHVDFEIPKASISSSDDDDDDDDDDDGGERKSKTILGKVSKKSRQFKKQRKQELMLRKKRARFTASDQLQPRRCRTRVDTRDV